MPPKPVFIWISGPPAAGKSSLAHRLIKEFERGIVIPVDDIREWVLSGYAGPVPWTEETERQYRIGEEAACSVALRYVQGDFTAIIDACRNPKRVDELLGGPCRKLEILKILLLPTLEANLERAHSRTNKGFDPYFLDGVIEATHFSYGETAKSDWLILDNTEMTLDGEVQRVLDRLEAGLRRN